MLLLDFQKLVEPLTGNNLGQGLILFCLDEDVGIHEIKPHFFGQQHPHRAFPHRRHANQCNIFFIFHQFDPNILQ